MKIREVLKADIEMADFWMTRDRAKLDAATSDAERQEIAAQLSRGVMIQMAWMTALGAVVAHVEEPIARVLREQEARLDEARQERLLRWHITSNEGQGELDAVVNIEKERLTGMHMLAAALREER